MEHANSHSDSINQDRIETAVDEVETSSILNSKPDETQEVVAAISSSSNPSTVTDGCSRMSVIDGDRVPNQPLVIGADSKIEEKALESEADGGPLLEPPVKRLKTSDVSPEFGEQVISNTLDVAAGTKEAIAATASSAPTQHADNVGSSHASSFTSTTQLLLPDYASVRQTVQDLLALLQLYGPLTANQLEYNLPPVVPTSTPWNVHDVLSILVAIGLVQQVKGSTDQYCIFGGVPRATAIYPTEIPSEIQRAINEAEGSYKRCQILREALRHANTTTNDNHDGNNHGTKNYLSVLKQLLQEYPNIINDPVYWTALRSCRIDIGNGTSNMPPSERRSGTTSKSNKGTASTKEARSKSSKGATAVTSGNKTISNEKNGVMKAPTPKEALPKSMPMKSEQQLSERLNVDSSATAAVTAILPEKDSSNSSEQVVKEKMVEKMINQPPTQEEAATVTLAATAVPQPKAVTKASIDITATTTETT